MFLCQVALGEVAQLAPSSSLRIPPLKPGSLTERYDSVGGVTGGSQVYICMFFHVQMCSFFAFTRFCLAVYGDGRAYPKYLVTYSLS
jgi:hypothetical protein